MPEGPRKRSPEAERPSEGVPPGTPENVSGAVAVVVAISVLEVAT